ncbi:unnamed protein product [Heligmosomoides polygyrus]|uniref:RRM domain-containing protein n=1 Tax=Heligmosomoides polygyrus TaxID=6339 RepID=A0A183G6A4_HELPZ|nr:unnamed protein product [Heligmosomoides polygyrus]
MGSTLLYDDVSANDTALDGLYSECSEEDIGSQFSQAGRDTDVHIVTDSETARPKGFDSCEFADEAGAENAVNTLSGTTLKLRN